MTTPPTEQQCKRHKAVIDGENFYIIVGPNFVHATIPDENKATARKLLKITQMLCHEITAAMGGED